jgi:hypothetical protein
MEDPLHHTGIARTRPSSIPLGESRMAQLADSMFGLANRQPAVWSRLWKRGKGRGHKDPEPVSLNSPYESKAPDRPSLYIRMTASLDSRSNTPFIPLRDKNRPFCDFWRNSIDLYERIEQGSL